MIQKIVKDSDIKFNVSEDSKIQDKFIIKFYTISKSTVITKTAENVIFENEKRYIKLNWSELRHLENGMINYEVNNLDSDADYNDGVYNSTFSRTTYYYLYTDTNSGGGGAGTEEIEQKIDDLNNRVSGVETKVDQVVTDLNKEKEDRAQGDTNLTNTITENDAQYQRKFNRYDRVHTTYYQYIQDLQNRVTELELGPRVTALETDIQDLNNRANVASTRYNDISSRYNWSYTYSQFEENMTALEQKVSALETKTQDIQNSVPVVETNNGINDRALTLETDTQDLKESLPLADRVTALETKDNGNKERMSSTENGLDDFDAKFPKDTNSGDIKQKVTALTDRVTALETGTQDIQNSMSVVETDNDNLVNRASSVVEPNNDGIANQSLTLEERVTALESKYNDFDSSLFSVEHGLEDVSGAWPPSRTSYKDIQERLTTLENRIKALESK